MARYIDADALIFKIVNTPFVVRCSGETDDYKNGVLDGLVKKQHNVIDMIQKQPTADVVEVVRCKNCEFYNIDEDGKGCCEMTIGCEPKLPTDFCSDGKRKTQKEGNNDK